MAVFPKALMPHPKVSARKPVSNKKNGGPPLLPAIVTALVVAVGIFSLPTLLAIDLRIEGSKPVQEAFPVTVNPGMKQIVYDAHVEALLSEQPTTLAAAAITAHDLFTWLAVKISEIPAYRNLAGANTLFVTIEPGYREEQVATIIGNTLHWTPSERRAFIKAADARDPSLTEGQFVPGTYFLSVTDPVEVEGLLHDRFQKEIIERYNPNAAQQLPLKDALTVASLIERESGGWQDMRLISGVIWNRIFVGMNLQIDATLQYAKATNSKSTAWWPPVLPRDKNIRSAYNTYQHPGLPPSPIADPSVAAVVAALNPKQTDCLFYFHDQYGTFHCSKTYAGHVKLLKKYYGQGK